MQIRGDVRPTQVVRHALSGARPCWVPPAGQSRSLLLTQEGWQRKRSPRSRARGVPPRLRHVCEPEVEPSIYSLRGAGVRVLT